MRERRGGREKEEVINTKSLFFILEYQLQQFHSKNCMPIHVKAMPKPWIVALVLLL